MQETRGGAARATAQTSEREVVRDAARVNVCAKAAYLSTIGALFSRWGDDYEAAYEAARATAADLAIAPRDAGGRRALPTRERGAHLGRSRGSGARRIAL